MGPADLLKLAGEVDSIPVPHVEIRAKNFQYAKIEKGKSQKFTFMISNKSQVEWYDDSRIVSLNPEVLDKFFPLQLKQVE